MSALAAGNPPRSACAAEPARARGWRARLASSLAWVGALLIYVDLLAIVPVATLIGRIVRPRGSPARRELKLLVIGTFYTRNWAISHLSPLVRAAGVGEVIAVVDGPVAPLGGVRYVHPPAWARGGLLRAICKLGLAARYAVRSRPNLVMGYHLLPGAMSALLVGRLINAATAYQLTAGPIELIGGGAATENFFLKRLQRCSPLLERLAHRVARQFDLLVVRGTQARRYLERHVVGPQIEIMPGSLDPALFADAGEQRDIDVISVCRLVEIKQPEHILHTLAKLAERRPTFRAVLLGDGPLRPALEAQARRLGIDHQIDFRGHVDDVATYLRRARVFLLTSRSEGLSIAMAEAMAAGAVPVVADVGELRDLARHAETGYCVPPGDFATYADVIDRILADPAHFARLSAAAREMAVRHNGVADVAQRWDAVLHATCSRARRSQRPQGGSGARRKLWQATPPLLRQAASPVLQRIPAERLLGRSFCGWRDLVRRMEHAGSEEIATYQLGQLRRVLEVAARHTRYYGAMIDATGRSVTALQHREAFTELPFLTADIVRARSADLRNSSAGAPAADLMSTGGTGGQPLQFWIDRDRSAFEYAHLTASWQRAGFGLGDTQAVFRGDVVARRSDGLRHTHDPLLRRHYYSTFHLSDVMIQRYLAHIATIGPCYLQGYPSALAALARCVERGAAEAPGNVSGVLLGSENVYPEQRALIARVFGGPVFTWYGQSEKVVLAAECEHSTNYHVWSTYGYFELVDERGAVITTPGRRGEIVGTSFVNTVMPFIRYRTGDYATYVGERCDACGRWGPVIRDVRGHRQQELLVARDGALISWTALNMHDRTFNDVRQFQFRQHRPGAAVLELVPAQSFDDHSRRRIERALQRKLGGQIELDLELVREIPLSPRGKTMYVQQHLEIPDLQRGETP